MLNFTVNPTLEYIYDGYLHGIAFIVLPLNLFTFYLICKKTSKHSQTYRYFVLHIQFWSTLVDIHFGFLFRPMPLFPLVGTYCNGILCRAGLPIYYSIIDMSLFFFLVALFSQVPTITLMFAKTDKSTATVYLTENHPAMLWITKKENWIAYDKFAFPASWIAVEATVLVTVFPLSYFIMSVHLYRGICTANFLSLKTRKMHKHIVMVLITQIVLFSIFLGVPVPVFIVAVFTERIPHGVNLFFFAMLMFYSWTHSIVLIATTPSYRTMLTKSKLSFPSVQLMRRSDKSQLTNT